jgi:hypothetical protein
LFGQWAGAGFEPDSFWLQTPRLIMAALEGRMRADTDKLAWHAWHVAALSRSKKLPRLDAMLKPKKSKKAQTPDAMMAVMNALVMRTGGTIEGGEG